MIVTDARKAGMMGLRCFSLHELAKAGITVECTDGHDLDDNFTKLIEAATSSAHGTAADHWVHATRGKAAKLTELERY